MNLDLPPLRRLAALSVVVCALAAAHVPLSHGQVMIWLPSFALVAGIWITVFRMQRRYSAAANGQERLDALVRDCEWAAMLLAIGLAALLGKALGSQDELFDRVYPIAMGAMLVGAGNFLPKRRFGTGFLTGESYPVRRFAGWCYVLGGAAYVAIWVCAPLRLATTLAGVAAATMGVAVIVRVAISRWSPRRTH